MSGHLENSNDSENVCVLCFKEVEYYSIGSCDHAVCFECSTRMRILCKQRECPICRRELPKVFFTKKVESFTVLSRYRLANLQDSRYGIIFCFLEIQKAYYKLLEHRCNICEELYKTFNHLKDHVKRKHEMFYCDICSQHLKIFSFERMCYNRKDLAHHRRIGDKDNTSHRGHPLCKFCDMRFMDNDELFRHLRRIHLFCHLCDADGKHQYYNCMEDLKRHFKEEHFLCEEGECKTMALTAVFRTEIDLKAHVATEHSKSMSKSATRQARTLEFEFTMTPRPRSDYMRNARPNGRRDRYEDENTYSVEPGGPGDPSIHTPSFVNPLTSEHFPALGGIDAAASNNITLVSKNYTRFSNAAFNSNDFPSLGGSSGRPTSAVTITANSSGASAPEVTITRTDRNQHNQKQRESFPALGGPSKASGSRTVRLSVNSASTQPQAPKVSIQVNQNPNGAITTHITTNAPSTFQRTDVFPALDKNSRPQTSAQPQWVQPKPKKPEEPKPNKVAPGPLVTSDLNSFPSLLKGTNDKPTKSSSVTVPVDSWVNLNCIRNGPKSNKKGESSSKMDSIANRTEEKATKGNGYNTSKKGEWSKKGNNASSKNPSNNAPTSNLDAKLDNLKFVDAKAPRNKISTTEESKKAKKKKTKNVGDPGTSNDETNLDNTNKNVEPALNNKKETKSETKDFNQNEKETNKNGLTKKISELKIGALSNTNSLIGNEDFPSLGSTKPPPGFAKPVSAQSPVKPPPGFNSSNFPPLNFSNDLTFTTSSGQSYAISPTKGAPTYKQPQSFQNRNQNLIRRFMEVLNDDDLIREFKTLSDKFRKGDVPAKKYHEHCRNILGNKFNDVFPELLVLLPDIDKQQELYKELNGKSKEHLLVCENCQQVIFKQELSEHYNHHRLENHFPTLGSAQQINSAWKK